MVGGKVHCLLDLAAKSHQRGAVIVTHAIHPLMQCALNLSKLAGIERLGNIHQKNIGHALAGLAKMIDARHGGWTFADTDTDLSGFTRRIVG